MQAVRQCLQAKGHNGDRMNTTSHDLVTDFVAQQTIALVGASRSGRKFGNVIFKALKARDHTVYLIHPSAQTIGDETCYSSFATLPTPVQGVIIVTKPDETTKVVQSAIDAGIKRIWIQQGAESPEALKLCADHKVSVVYKECILMFAEPVGFPHNVHRCLWRWLGKLPA
jgi:predicted CoA-binding protein